MLSRLWIEVCGSRGAGVGLALTSLLVRPEASIQVLQMASSKKTPPSHPLYLLMHPTFSCTTETPADSIGGNTSKQLVLIKMASRVIANAFGTT